ncbi:inositol 2-dehydrogenase [Pseudogracilibacillus sp. SE30717A]|uniref:inositol 2-dehydrogenase n=1 Tax=Pseudogracilibacillus sp. SE30717A TaxID=3098293 RepID=UPI00300DC812
MRKVTIGIIGAGRIGRLHANNIINFSDVRLKTISDLSNEHVTDWAKGIGIEQVVTNNEEIINDEEIDAIFVCSPSDTHANIILAAARKGKHIFCEKPISFSIKETKEVLDVVESAGVQLQVGFNRRFDRNFLRIRESIKKGVIGTPQIIKITTRDPKPPPLEYVKQSGGLFYDMSIHDFDMARFLINSEVVQVYSIGTNLIEPYIEEEGDVDTAIISIKFANGAIGVIDNSRKAVYGSDQRVEVFGEKGCLTCENERLTTVEFINNKGAYQDKLKHFFERYKDAFIAEARSFIDSVQTGDPVVCNGNDGLQAGLIASAAQQSHLEGCLIKINQFKE